jgi:hypothetical protein
VLERRLDLGHLAQSLGHSISTPTSVPNNTSGSVGRRCSPAVEAEHRGYRAIDVCKV